MSALGPNPTRQGRLDLQLCLYELYQWSIALDKTSFAWINHSGMQKHTAHGTTLRHPQQKQLFWLAKDIKQVAIQAFLLNGNIYKVICN